MEPDRFDDVGFRIVEEPAPPPRRTSLRLRMALALSAWILGAGALAAGASALTGAGGEAAGEKARDRPSVQRTADGIPYERSGMECEAGKARHERSQRGSDARDYCRFRFAH